MFKRGYPLICLAVLLCAVCCQSCKKGCIDPKAYNYEHNAKQNDGSCLYCDSTVQDSVAQSFYTIYDQNPSSPQYGQPVLSLSATGNLMVYTGNGCKHLGLGTGASGCTDFSYTASFYNTTGSSLTFSGIVYISDPQAGRTVVTYTVSSLTLAPSTSTTITLGSGCSQSIGFNLTETTNSLSYH